MRSTLGAAAFVLAFATAGLAQAEDSAVVSDAGRDAFAATAPAKTLLGQTSGGPADQANSGGSPTVVEPLKAVGHDRQETGGGGSALNGGSGGPPAAERTAKAAGNGCGGCAMPGEALSAFALAGLGLLAFKRRRV